MKIVCDNKIPFLRGVLEPYAEVVYLPGKETTAESNPQQAAADGTVVFHATAAGSPRFWRAKATSTEIGN